MYCIYYRSNEKKFGELILSIFSKLDIFYIFLIKIIYTKLLYIIKLQPIFDIPNVTGHKLVTPIIIEYGKNFLYVKRVIQKCELSKFDYFDPIYFWNDIEIHTDDVFYLDGSEWIQHTVDNKVNLGSRTPYTLDQ
jgi:hypothetical protein